MFAEVAEQLREFKAEILPMVSNAMSYGDVPVFRLDPVRHDKDIITNAPKVSLFRVTSGKIRRVAGPSSVTITHITLDDSTQLVTTQQSQCNMRTDLLGATARRFRGCVLHINHPQHQHRHPRSSVGVVRLPVGVKAKAAPSLTDLDLSTAHDIMRRGVSRCFPNINPSLCMPRHQP